MWMDYFYTCCFWWD